MRAKNTTARLLFAFAGPALAGAAHAQSQLGTTYDEIVAAGAAPGDKSREILYNLLSDFSVNPFTEIGAANTLLGNLFFIFNSGIFVVGTGLLTYFLLSTVAQTAHEGEVLGKRINGLWVPIRVTFGVFGMLPVFGGFSLAQAILMLFVTLGIGLANLLTTSAIDQTEQFNALIPPPGIATDGTQTSFSKEFAQNLFLMNVCVESAKRYHADATNSFNTRAEPRMSMRPLGRETQIESLGIPGWGNSCGKILLKRDGGRQSNWYTLGYRSAAVNYEEINALSDVAYEKKSDVLLQMNNMLNAEAIAFVNAYYDPASESEYRLDISMFSRLAIQANDAVSQAVKQAVDGTSSAEESKQSALTESARNAIRDGGWITLGSWYSTYAEVQAALQSAAYNGQLIETPIKINESAQNGTLTRLVSAAQSYLERPVAVADSDFATNSPGRWLVDSIFSGIAVDSAGKGMVNPITTAKNMGDWMINGAIAMYTLSTLSEMIPGGKTVLDVVGKIPGPGKIASMLKAIFSDLAALLPVIGLLLLVIGGMLSIYVPLIPFFTWFSSLIAYFASVIEGLIAAQIWAFGHLSLDGEGMGNKTEKGYVYLLNMLLRPPLMVLGFFFASAILVLLGTFLIQELRTVIENVQGNSMTGVISIFGYLTAFAIILVTLVSTVFSMIFEIPDRVISYLGGGQEAQMGRNMTNEVQGQAHNAARWAGGAGHAMQVGRAGLQTAKAASAAKNGAEK
ncbi:DotA/TraY family protein [Pollutimonas sp. H1-120]|uniref:DotA/TraY family protein n=1 Tax=Pollutimonas sp. H1-120 TaxID=3148824 RepID=UPI003B51BA1F